MSSAMQKLSVEEHQNHAESNNERREFLIASKKHQRFSDTSVTHGFVRKSVETGAKVSIFKVLRTFRATPKPWVAGSNPPAPAITEAKRLRFFSFCRVLFCISLSKAEMTKFFNTFRSKSPSSLSNNSVCSNLSVWYSIKKAAATAEFSFLRSLFYLFGTI